MLRWLVLVSCLTGCSLYFEEDDGPSGDGGGGGGGGGSSAACAPALSSNRWIVFDADDGQFNRDIYRMRADGSNVERLTSAPSLDRQPAASPDGHTIAFTSSRSGSLQIYLLDLVTKAVTQLTHHNGDAEEPSFSHDGELVAFRSGSSVYTIPVGGTTETLVMTSDWDAFNAFYSPQFSADDSELMFDRNNEILAVHLDGSGFRHIVNNWTTTIKSPTASPSGTAVAYEVYCGGIEIWATPSQVGTDPCKGRQITPSAASESRNPAWGPDDYIAYEDIDGANVGSIAVIGTTPGASPCVLASDGYDRRNPDWLVEP